MDRNGTEGKGWIIEWIFWLQIYVQKLSCHMVSFLQEAGTVQSLHLSLREKEEELGRAMKEHLHMASALPTKVENHRCGLHECVVV